MSGRLFSLIVAAGAATTLAGSAETAGVGSAAVTPRPNILVILADDLGYGELTCQGGKDVPTPHLDSLAAKGTRFTSGYVSAPVCSPSRAGLMTGRYGVRFGIELNPGFSHAIGLPVSETTIAEHLKAVGYATGMFGKWHLGFKSAMQPNRRGFDEYFGFLGCAHSYVDVAGGHDKANVIMRNGRSVSALDYTTDAFGREAAAFIEKHHAHPWFVYLPFNATHGPMQAPEKYSGRCPELRGDRRTFAGMLAALDDNIGLVLAKLREHKLEENTLIIFLSDNGAPNHGATANSNLPLRGYKAQLLEGGIREPFLIQWKGYIPAGKVDDRPVISLDILPTALAAAGVRLPAGTDIDGVNLLPYLTGEKTGPPHTALCWRYSGQHAVRMGDWKLLHMDGKTRLYNLATDRGETNSLAKENPETLKTLESVYAQWNAKNARSHCKGRGGHGKHDEKTITSGEATDSEMDGGENSDEDDDAPPRLGRAKSL